MLSTAKPRAIVQLVAMTLHTFLLGIVVLAAASQVSDREGAYRPAGESRLAALGDFIDGTALKRGAERNDGQGPAGFLASAVFHSSRLSRSALPSVYHVEPLYQLPIAGALPIRSPPLQLPL
jgi:hypothetical protein